MRKRDYRDYLEDMLTSIMDIESFTEGMTFDSFKGDKKTVYAVIRCIEVMGEAAMKIPGSFKDKHAAIPWQAIVGMRNRMIHEYFGVDINILWETVKTDIPSVKPAVRGMLESLE